MSLTTNDKLIKQKIELQRLFSEELKTISKISPYRFIIMKHLYLHQTSFKRLKDFTALSDGNLASNLRFLELQGWIEVIKEFENRRVKTSYKLTKKGITIQQKVEKFYSDYISLASLNKREEREV